MITMEVDIDERVHRRIIGKSGKNIRKLMEQFGAEIRIPKDSPMVTITGPEENCEACKEHLLMLEEEYVSCVYTLLQTIIDLNFRFVVDFCTCISYDQFLLFLH